MEGDVAGYDRSADFLRQERGFLDIEGADSVSFLVVQHGMVACPGNVVGLEFRRRAHVDDLVKFG